MKKLLGNSFLILVPFAILITACRQSVERPVVRAIYPSSNAVPENLLRMYVQFSHPMKTTGNLERIKLIDEEGKEVNNVFFNNVYELWNREQTQLTLILDPARVKTGLVANESWGRAISANSKYTLLIDGLEDVNHNKMAKPFEWKMTVERADVQIPNINQWKMEIPNASSRNDLIIGFPQMLDYNSMRQRLVVTNEDKKPLPGTVFIGKEEKEWRFKPRDPWGKGSYLLYINTRLEDPAGNNLNGLFDHKEGTLRYEKEGMIETIPILIN